MRKMAVKRRLMVLMSFVTAVCLCLTGCSSGSKNSLKFSTGGTGGIYYQYGGKLAELLSESDSGVVVTEVQEKSLAFRSGLKRGDIIMQAGGREVEKTSDLFKAISSAKRNRVPLLIKRGSRTQYLPLYVK